MQYNLCKMCGRFSLALDMGALVERYDLRIIDFPSEPRFNIAPTQNVVTIVRDDDHNQNLASLMRWRLVPFWAKDPTIGNRMINARPETVAERNSFRQAFQKRRCLVVADSFYEWRKTPRGKVPMRIILKEGSPFGFAGLWETWRQPDGAFLNSCTYHHDTECSHGVDPRPHAGHTQQRGRIAVARPGEQCG